MKSILFGTLLFLGVYGVIWFLNKRRMEQQATQHNTTAKPDHPPRKLENRSKK